MADEWDEVLRLVNDSWPHLQITKNDLLHPTSSMVVNVYSNFVVEFEEKVQFLAGPYTYSPTESNDNLDVEERLFQTVYQIFNAIEKHMIMLSDFYDPVPIRSKNFLKICSHLLSFAESILEDAENLASNIIKMKENGVALETELEQVLLEIHQKAVTKSELIETQEKLNQEFSEIKHSDEEMKKHMQQKAIIYSKERKEIELLKQQLEPEEQELSRLENKEKELSEHLVSDSEHKNLISIIKNLEIEYKSLGSDQVDMDDVLVHENEELLHLQDIRKRVPEVDDFDLQIVETVIDLDEELKDLQIENEKLINNLINPLKVVKMQNQTTLKELKQQIEKDTHKYQEMLRENIDVEEKLCQNITKQKEEFETAVNHYTKLIQILEQEIERLCTNRNKLRNIFHTEYNKIAAAEANVKEYFKHALSKFNGFT